MEVRVERLTELHTDTKEMWAELASRISSPNPFWEPVAALTAARTLPEGDEVSLVSVVDDSQMLLATPVIRRRRFRRIPVDHFEAWTHTQCCAGNPLVDQRATADVWSVVLRRLKREGASWLVLPLVDVHTEAMHRLNEALRARHRRPRALDTYERPVVLKRTEQAVEIGLSSRHRSDLRRQRRGLDRQLGSETTARDLLNETELDDAITTFLDVEASGWKGRAGTAIASHSEEEEFFRELCARLHDEGRLQIWCLGSETQPIALACNVLTGETVVRFKLCYDEEYRRFSPGVQLELEMLAAFEVDDRRRWLDSCAAEANEVYQRIYPDSHTTATVIAPTGGPGSRALAALTPMAAKTLKAVKRTLASRRRV
jgi:CelD/BcsL family acetyltransferase involved in cellulose biosynthesis